MISGGAHLSWSEMVTMAWHVLGLRMKKQPPIWMVAVNILDKQSRRGKRGSPPAWGMGEAMTSQNKNWQRDET